MKKNKRVVFFLTSEQWLGLVLLVILVMGTLIAVKRLRPQEDVEVGWSNDSTKMEFVAYQVRQDSIRKAQWKKTYKRDTIAIRLQVFDPNTADSSTLVHLGFKPWQAKNLLKYRAKGGRYRRPEDLKRLYGMTDSMYQTLQPYIQIVRTEVDSLRMDSMGRDSLWRDTTRYDSMPKWQHVKKDTILNLRTADTTELKMIRGVGSYRAKQIVRYRDALGGFVRVEQLREVEGMELVADSVLKHFVLDSANVKQLNVNSMGVRQLSRHPYLRFEDAKAIYELRRRKIKLDSIEQLYELETLSEETIKKVAPYLNFDKNS
jgi:competence ComEA-like helix-hairpin-helix protein